MDFIVSPDKSASFAGRRDHGHRNRPGFQADEAWDEHLHHLLGAPWPCRERQRFDEVMASIRTLLTAKGWGFGRDTYAWYADADSSTVPCGVVRDAAHPA